MYTNIYIYIYKERERERESEIVQKEWGGGVPPMGTSIKS